MPLGERADDVQNRLLDSRLKREGEIAMAIANGLVPLAQRTERLREPLFERLFESMGVETNEVPVDRKSSVRLQVNEFTELFCVGGATGAGERHDGALFKHVEPQMRRDGRIEHAERVKELALPQTFEALVGHGAGGRVGCVPVWV